MKTKTPANDALCMTCMEQYVYDEGHTCEVVKENKQEGLKFDKYKLDWSCLPLEVIEPLVAVFQAGAVKYNFMNCLKPFENGDRRFFAAGMRHKVSCQHDPLAIDEETGCYHGAEDAWNSLIRLYHAKQNAKNKDLT